MVGRRRARGRHLRVQGRRAARARLAHRAAARCSARSRCSRSRCSPALVAISTFGDGRGLTIDARAAGLAVALGAVWLRAPFAVVVIAATVTAAGLRALGVG